MKKYIVLMLITFLCTAGLKFSSETLAAGRTYEGAGEGSAHCSLGLRIVCGGHKQALVVKNKNAVDAQ